MTFIPDPIRLRSRRHPSSTGPISHETCPHPPLGQSRGIQPPGHANLRFGVSILVSEPRPGMNGPRTDHSCIPIMTEEKTPSSQTRRPSPSTSSSPSLRQERRVALRPSSSMTSSYPRLPDAVLELGVCVIAACHDRLRSVLLCIISRPLASTENNLIISVEYTIHCTSDPTRRVRAPARTCA